MNKHPFIPAPAVVAFLFGLLCMSALSSCGELCEIFGHYERLAEPGIFIWDSMGIIMVSDDESGKDSAPVSRIMINWNIELSGFITDEDLKWLKNRCPRQYFTGKMIVGGAVLGRGMHMDDFI